MVCPRRPQSARACRTDPRTAARARAVDGRNCQRIDGRRTLEMRFIDLERLREISGWPPGRQPYPNMTIERWRTRLQAVQAALQNATSAKERADIIDKNGDLW